MRTAQKRFCGGLLAAIALTCCLANGASDEPAAPASAAELVQGVIDAENMIHEFASLRLRVEARTRFAPRTIAEAQAGRTGGMSGADLKPESTSANELVFDARRIRVVNRSGARSITTAWDGKVRKTLVRDPDGQNTAVIATALDGQCGSAFALEWLQIGAHRFWWSNEGAGQRGEGIPPGEFVLSGSESFHGESCYQLDCRPKLRRLYVSTVDRRLRGFVVFIAPSAAEDLALRSRIAGTTFATSEQFNAWRQELSDEARQTFDDDFDRGRFERVVGAEKSDGGGDPSASTETAGEVAQSTRPGSIGVPSQEWHFSDYRQIAPGFWLPHRWGIEVTGREKGETYPAMTAEATVVMAEVNPRLTDADFDVAIREGTATVDSRYDPPLRYSYRKNFTSVEWKTILDQQRHELAIIAQRTAAQKVRVGQQAAEFPAADGWFNSRPLAWKDLSGKIVILAFFSQSCGACQDDIPTLRALHEARGEAGVAVIAVHVGAIETEEAKKYLADREIDYPVYVDAGDLRGVTLGPICRWYSVDELPATVLVDAEGKVAAMGDLEELIDAAQSLAEAKHSK